MSQTERKVYIIGVGLTKFEKPGNRQWDYPDMGAEATIKALEDAGISYDLIQQATCGYVYGDTTCGQRALYKVGMTGIPIYNVNNACSTGSTAVYLGKQFIASGISECVLALGFEKMSKGALSYNFHDRTSPLQKHFDTMLKTREPSKAPFASQMFGNAGREHMEKYGTTKEHFAKVAYKNHKHSIHNPYAQFRNEVSLEKILASPNVYDPLTLLQCCPTSEGAGAVILASEDFVKKHNLEHQAIEIVAMSMKTDLPTSFEDSCIKMIGFDMTKLASEEVFQKSGYTPNDVQVIELHDCFSCNELITYEALGLCPIGKGGELIDSGDVTYGGKWVVNPSGGLISKGHPLGATGPAQISELCWQLRGMAGERQVKNCTLALQHNIGLGGAVVVGLYRHGFPNKKKPFPSNKINPALVATSPLLLDEKKVDQIEELFNIVSQKLSSDPSLVKKINSTYNFKIKTTSGVQSWVINLKDEPGSIKKGESSCEVTFSIDEVDFVSLMKGDLQAEVAFSQGKLSISGDLNKADRKSVV